MPAATVPELHGQHRNRVWRDDDGDIWTATPGGGWKCHRRGDATCSAIMFPIKRHGPYTEVPPGTEPDHG